MQGAFAEWHRVVFRLKGFTEQINAAFPRPAETHSSYSDPTPKHDMSLDPATAALESQNVALIGKVQNALCLTYAAMSAAHLKSEKWSKALRNALNALAIDPKNVKVCNSLSCSDFPDSICSLTFKLVSITSGKVSRGASENQAGRSRERKASPAGTI